MDRRLVCLITLIAACGPMAEEDVAATTEALNGTITFVSCNAVERAKLQEAMNHVTTQLGSGGLFSQCLQDATLAWTQDKTPEAIERALRANMPTRITCVADSYCTQDGRDGVACAPPNISTERINVERGYIASADIPTLAGTIAHEVIHNKGWTHPAAQTSPAIPAYEFTVPAQVGVCIGSEFGEVGEPAWLARTTLPRETELHMVGGGGGLPFELACGSCDFARGFHVGASATNVNKLSMICGQSTTPSTGTTNDSTGLANPILCPNDDVVVGLWTGSGTMINGFAPLCSKREDVRAGKQTISQWPVLAGTLEADQSTIRWCPPGMALKRLYGRSGARIDQLRIVCETLGTSPQGVPHSLALAGQALGTTQRAQCLGNGVLVSLWGGRGAEVDSLGGRCSPTGPGANGDVVTESPNAFELMHILPSVGGLGGVAFDDYCPGFFEGEALIGLRVRSGARIDQVQGICANATAWSGATTSVNRTYTPARGENSGYPSTLECPRGEFLVGMQVWSSQSTQHATPTVFGVQPICRRIDYPRPNVPVLQCIGDVLDPGLATTSPITVAQ